MWRVVYQQAPSHGIYQDAGPWMSSKEEAEKWLAFYKPSYPNAHLQAFEDIRYHPHPEHGSHDHGHAHGESHGNAA